MSGGADGADDVGLVELDEEDRKMILSNLFRIDDVNSVQFFMKKSRFFGRPDNEDLVKRMKALKEQIEECGGLFTNEAVGDHSVEIVFPEVVEGVIAVGDVFSHEYILECMNKFQILDPEPFRIGESPYAEINIHSIILREQSWGSAKRLKASPVLGRKLGDFGPTAEDFASSSSAGAGSKSVLVPHCAGGRKKTLVQIRTRRRADYTFAEDQKILKFVINNNLYRDLGGYEAWKRVEKYFPPHTYQSLHNRFRRIIAPSIHKYSLTPAERKTIGVYYNLYPSETSESGDNKYHDQESADEPANLTEIESVCPSTSADESSAMSPPNKTRTKASKRRIVSDTSEAECLGAETDGSNSPVRARPRIVAPKVLDQDVAEQETILDLSRTSLDRSLSDDLQPDKLDTALDELLTSPLRRRGRPRKNKAVDTPRQKQLTDSVLHSLSNSSLDQKDQSRASSKERKVVSDSSALDELNGSQPTAPSDVGSGVAVAGQDLKDSKKKKKQKRTAKKPDGARSHRFVSDSSEIDSTIESKSLPSSSAKDRKSKTSLDGQERRSLSSLNGRERRIITKPEFFIASPKQPSLASSADDVHIRRPYCLREDRLIVSYIKDEKCFDEVRGKTMWERLVEAVLKGRTWSSAKNRFLKHVIKNIEDYNLDETTIARFEAGLTAERNLGGASQHRKEELSPLSKAKSWGAKKMKKISRKTEAAPPPAPDAIVNSTRSKLVLEPSEAPATRFPKHPALACMKTPAKSEGRRWLYKRNRQYVIEPGPSTPTPQVTKDSEDEAGDERQDVLSYLMLNAKKSDAIPSAAAVEEVASDPAPQSTAPQSTAPPLPDGDSAVTDTDTPDTQEYFTPAEGDDAQCLESAA